MAKIELVNGPLQLYWAPVGEAMPDIGVAPGVNWELIGTSGADNYDESGVVLVFNKTYEVFRGLGNTYALKTFITETDAFVRVTLADISLAQLRLSFNNNAVANDVGPPDINTLDLDVGTTPTEMALLVRGDNKSPDFEDGDFQVEFNRVVENGSHELTFAKGGPAMSLLDFRVLLDDSGAVGRIVAQNA